MNNCYQLSTLYYHLTNPDDFIYIYLQQGPVLLDEVCLYEVTQLFALKSPHWPVGIAIAFASKDWQKPKRLAKDCQKTAKRPSDLCFTLPVAATLHIFYLSLFSFSDSEVALALKEQSIICLACLINIGYIIVLTPRLGVLFCTAIWVRYIKQTTQLKKNNTAFITHTFVIEFEQHPAKAN